MAILYPKLLANLVVKVGTRHSHQILLWSFVGKDTIRVVKIINYDLGPLLLTWFNFNLGMDK